MSIICSKGASLDKTTHFRVKTFLGLPVPPFFPSFRFIFYKMLLSNLGSTHRIHAEINYFVLVIRIFARIGELIRLIKKEGGRRLRRAPTAFLRHSHLGMWPRAPPWAQSGAGTVCFCKYLCVLDLTCIAHKFTLLCIYMHRNVEFTYWNNIWRIWLYKLFLQIYVMLQNYVLYE